MLMPESYNLNFRIHCSIERKKKKKLLIILNLCKSNKTLLPELVLWQRQGAEWRFLFIHSVALCHPNFSKDEASINHVSKASTNSCFKIGKHVS